MLTGKIHNRTTAQLHTGQIIQIIGRTYTPTIAPRTISMVPIEVAPHYTTNEPYTKAYRTRTETQP